MQYIRLLAGKNKTNIDVLLHASLLGEFLIARIIECALESFFVMRLDVDIEFGLVCPVFLFTFFERTRWKCVVAQMLVIITSGGRYIRARFIGARVIFSVRQNMRLQ